MCPRRPTPWPPDESSLASRAAGSERSYRPIDLLLDLAEVLYLLPETIQQTDWMDAFLLSAAADQILEDALAGRRSPGGRAWWRRVARELDRHEGSRAAAVAVRAAVSAADRILSTTPSSRRMAALHEQLCGLTAQLADALTDPAAAVDTGAVGCWARTVLDQSEKLPSEVLRQPLRLPSSFRSFDQHPADIEKLVAGFEHRWSGHSAPLLAVGVRTSGSYLAPLAAAALRRRGYRQVHSLTMRPLTSPGPRERRLLEQAARDGALVAVLDDPPASGESIRKVTDALEGFGIHPDNIVLLLAVQNETAELPAILERYAAVLLPWPEWHVHELLQPERVASTLNEMLPPGVAVSGVQRRYRPVPAGRDHVRAFYVADLVDGNAPARTLEIAVEGAGTGFFGRHVLGVAEALGKCVPRVFGFRDGLVFREWVHGPTAWLSMSEQQVYSQVASYTARRRDLLTVGRDRSDDLAGDQPVWEVASALLGSTLGRAALPLRPLLVEPLVRRLLSVRRPSVVDGRMDAERWHRGDEQTVVKVDFADGAFSNLDLYCYDPVFDLAGAAIEMDKEGSGPETLTDFRASYEAATGEAVDEERWLIYELVHLWDAERSGRLDRMEAELARSRAAQRYFSRVYMADLPTVTEGPLCAIDVDGVLETTSVGFPATTAQGALALRALRAHGYRTVLATGRSLGEVIDRCRNFDLAGGVAEYGSVLYDHSTRTVLELASGEEMDAVTAAHTSIAARAELELDHRFRYIARARMTRPGRLRSVSPILFGTLPPPPEGNWQFIVGEGQTDAVLPGVDKGRALSLLASRLVQQGEAPVPPVQLAVGDTGSDLSMLRQARLSCAPANCLPILHREGIIRLRHSYQRGLADAVGMLIGHPPGGCAICALPAPPRGRRLLLELLSIQEDGGGGMPWRATRLALGLAARGIR